MVNKKFFTSDFKIVVVGLGYVGLPLAVALGQHYRVIGYDTDKTRISMLAMGEDTTKEISKTELTASDKLELTDDSSSLNNGDIFIITVPTPIDKYNNPDLRPLVEATQLVGKFQQKVILLYTSQRFPGATESICVPILEEKSNLEYNKDFFVAILRAR